jgi:hypothetical protein
MSTVAEINAAIEKTSLPHEETTEAREAKPWHTPGPEKEAWKQRGNYLDYREFKRSRPSDLKITISPPRQFDLK